MRAAGAAHRPSVIVNAHALRPLPLLIVGMAGLLYVLNGMAAAEPPTLAQVRSAQASAGERRDASTSPRGSALNRPWFLRNRNADAAMPISPEIAQVSVSSNPIVDLRRELEKMGTPRRLLLPLDGMASRPGTSRYAPPAAPTPSNGSE